MALELLCVCVCAHKAILYNYVVIFKYELLVTVHARTHSAAVAGKDVITEDELLALFTLEMSLTVERDIHQ